MPTRSRPAASPARTRSIARLLLFNKPYGVLSQFTDAGGRATLKDFIDVPGVYVAGRLDRDREGLLLLTDDGRLQNRLSHPKHGKAKRYLVQVEGTPDEDALAALRSGVTLKDGPTRPARVAEVPPPGWLWPRDPPVRFRKSVPDTWLAVTLREGRNRQLRRMTAHLGHPTLRLIRTGLGAYELGDLEPGAWRDA